MKLYKSENPVVSVAPLREIGVTISIHVNFEVAVGHRVRLFVQCDKKVTVICCLRNLYATYKKMSLNSQNCTRPLEGAHLLA